MIYFPHGQEDARAEIDALTSIVEKGFAAVAEDITEIKHDMATKEQIIALHTQVNSIETELRGMKHTKLPARVADLEEKGFGAARSKNPPTTTLYQSQPKPFDQPLGLVEVRMGSLSTLQRDIMSSMVVSRCPYTDEEVATGLVMDLVSFSHLVLNSAELNCPACGNTHEWAKSDAWLSITHIVEYPGRANGAGRTHRRQ